MGVPKYQIFFRKKNDSLEWDLFVYVTLGRWWWGIHLLINHLQTSQLSRFHRVSQGFSAFLMVPQFFIGSSFLMGLQILSWFLPKLSFLKKKHTQAAHSNAAEEHISRIINKNKTSSHSSLYLTGKLLFTKSVKTHIDNPFYWKPPSDLPKIMKKLTGEYNGHHSSK